MEMDQLSWVFNLFSVLLGLIVGSFLNVVVARVPHGQSVVRPRSKCPGCGATIAWYDNIPVLSYLLLRGKCRRCAAKISVRYPVIELLTGLLFLAATVRFGWSPLLLIRDWPFLAILVAVSFIDLEHRLIPDVLSLPGIVLGIATSWLDPRIGLVTSLAGGVIGFGFFYLLALGYYKATGRAGLGGGDVKLLAMLGAFLGPQGVFVTILISSVFGSLVGIAWGWADRLKTGKKGGMMTLAIPYGPFLVIGGLYYYLIGDLVWLPFMNQM